MQSRFKITHARFSQIVSFAAVLLSGFTFCRNAEIFEYPVVQSVRSLLPLVDELVVAIGEGQPADRTDQNLRELNNPKIKILKTVWDLQSFQYGSVHAQQTDLAKAQCGGQWLVYLQADEVLHEADLDSIRHACEQHHQNPEVEAFALRFHHFWGSFSRTQTSHGWYQREVRVIRNLPEIHSFGSAQSFRYIPEFDGRSYHKKEGTRKVRAVEIDARVFHYGWTRNPRTMVLKMNELDRIHSHTKERFGGSMNYGDVKKLTPFTETHPAVMAEWIKQRHELTSREAFSAASALPHQKWTRRLVSWVEKTFLGGRSLFAYKGYVKVG